MPALRLAADPADAEAHIDCRALIGGEQAGVEHDLAIGDGDQIGRDIGGQIASVCLGDRQSGERAAAELRRQLGGALQHAGVDIEDIARIGLAAGGLTRQQCQLAVCGGVLRQIVDDDQRVAASVAEILRPW